MVAILGHKPTTFKPKDSDTEIHGTTFYTAEDFAKGSGEGKRSGHFFLSDAKASRLAYIPDVGDVVEIYYNRYGSIESFRQVDEVVDL